MVNIYLFIELIRAASAPDVADRIKGLSLANCKFANVVVCPATSWRLSSIARRPRTAPRSCWKSCPKSKAWCRPTSSPW